MRLNHARVLHQLQTSGSLTLPPSRTVPLDLIFELDTLHDLRTPPQHHSSVQAAHTFIHVSLHLLHTLASWTEDRLQPLQTWDGRWFVVGELAMAFVVTDLHVTVLLVIDLEDQSQALEGGALFDYLDELLGLLEAVVADGDALDVLTTFGTHDLQEPVQCRKITALEVVETVEGLAGEAFEVLVAEEQRCE